LKIKDIETYVVCNPERSLSAGPSSLIVKVKTDEGIVGIGESCTHGEYNEASFAAKAIVDKGFKPLLVGENPIETKRLWHKLYYASEWYGRRGIAIYALSAVDMALWDAVGKYLNQPIHALLGGKFRSKIRVYASLLFDMEKPENSAKEGSKYVKEGFTAVKYGWGQTRETSFGLDPNQDEEVVSVIRDGLGKNTDLMVDVGRFVNWTPHHALEMANRLKKYDIYWLEEALPQDDIDGLAWLSARAPVRIAAGEGYYTLWDFQQLITKRAVHVVQPDVGKAGGISELKKIGEFASLYNTTVVMHGFSTAINVAANLHLVANMPNVPVMEFRRTKSPLIYKLLKKPFVAEEGALKIPDGPGLGIEIDEDVLEAHVVRA
jgi:L-alanine-DL-glutamate epimerase-like enolase superfamily enzyme